MKLKSSYEKQDDIPQAFRELFTEQDGKWVFTGVEGGPTPADVARLQKALDKERLDHKAAKEKLTKFGEVNPDTVAAELEELATLRLAAETDGKKPNAEELKKLVDGRVSQETAKLQKTISELQKTNDTLNTNLKAAVDGRNQDQLRSALRKAAVDAKIASTAVDDAELLGTQQFEFVDDRWITKADIDGVTPGVTPDVWIKEVTAKRTHWLPPSVGGGARGGDHGVAQFTGNNPWSAEHWNATEQARVINKYGQPAAEKIARSAGSAWDAIERPAASK